MTDDELPRDPDWDDVPEDLVLLANLEHGQPLVLSPDGFTRDTLVVVPSMFAYARRAQED